MGVRRLGRFYAVCAALLATLAPKPFAFADGSGPMEPFPITGAYSAFHREDRDHISIIEIAGDYNKNLGNGAPNVEPRAVIAREFFRKHPDKYDFLVAFSTFEFDTGDATAFHWAVQNKVQGIGIPPFDNTALFGSAGKLQGFIDMAALTRYKLDPLDPEFETALSVLAHEMLHQWGSFVKFKLPDGSVSDALLGRSGAHWSYLLDSNASVEYGADWKDNGDGTFTSVGIRKFFSPLDLYLMGFYKPQEVPPFFLIDNPQIDHTQLPQENVTITGTKRQIAIEDIIAAEGPRVPAAEQAQKEFRLGFILLAGPNQEVSDAQIAALNHVRNAFMTRFAILTAGRAVAQAHPEALPAVTVGTPTPVGGEELRETPASIAEGLAWLRSRQRAEGFWSDKDTTAVRDTTVVAAALFSLDGAFSGADAALQWLSANPSANTDYLARHARFVSELGADAASIRTQLLALQNVDGGWGIAQGFQSNALDTALAVLALAGSGNAAALDKAAQYLLAKQNADGGWSNAPGSPSRATVTTTVLQALRALGRHTTVAAGALAWLKTKQNPDGGFGDSPSTVHDTANTLQALIALDAVDQVRADDAASYLLSRQTTSGSWEGSVYATATAVAALKRFSFPNWVATGITAAPAGPRDGDRVALTITVTNDANVGAPAGVLRVYDGVPGSGGTQIGADLAVPALGPGAGVTFNPFWDTFDKAGTHTLVAVVDPDGVQTEMSESDNRASTVVTVQPAPAGVDLTFGEGGVTVTPAQPNRLPTTLGISVSVRNLGLTDAHNVRVLLWAGPVGSTLVGETTLDVLSRSTVLANFSYVLTQPGNLAFTAQIDPDNAIGEANETNNAAAAEIATAPSVDLVVRPADISVDKNPAFLGEDVVFKVRLRNEGTVDAPSTLVRYLITDGNTTRELRTNSIQLGAGQSTEQTIAWRVDLSGAITFTAQLDPDGLVPETDEANNVASLSLTAGAVTGPNLVVSFQDFTFAPNPGREGYPLVLSALVRNTGTVAATDAEIAFYNGDPAAGGTQIETTQVIPSLAPGESTTVSVTWPAIPDSADKLLFVVADPANRIAEFAETDNAAFNLLPVLSLPDLATSSGDIGLSPAFPRTGETVAITVRVANLGAQPAANVVVRAYEGDPAAGGTPIGGDQTLALIDGFGSGIVTFGWTSSVVTSARPIVVQVDPASAILERTRTNNTARRDIAIQDGNLYVTNKYFSPDGDGMKDSTQLFFRLQTAADIGIEVWNKRDAVVRRFGGAALANVTGGDIVWDGLDDLGRVVPDGAYRLRVVGSAASALGEVTVYVDNNRSSLLESLGTPFQSFRNLTCELPDVNDVTVSNDDATAFFYISSGASPQAAYPRGIYRMEGDGTDVRAIVPESFFARLYGTTPSVGYPWQMRPAANGSRVAFSRADNRTSLDPHWIVDADGKNLHEFELENFYTPYRMAPDGNTVYALSNLNKTLLAIPADGLSPPRTLFTVTEIGSFSSIDSNSLKISPDGRKIALQAYDGSRWSPWIIDAATGAGTRLIDDDSYGYVDDIQWAPTGTRLLVRLGEEGFRVFDQSGTLVRAIAGPEFVIPPEADFWDIRLSDARWASSGTEFAFTGQIIAYDRFERRVPADPGGIYVADVATGKVEKAAPFSESQCGECGCGGCASYHISTWDGGNWVERGVLHYGLHYREQTLDLSSYLPDAGGEYRVRIRQQGMDAAHVETVALLAAGNRLAPETALHLGAAKDVLAPVLHRDNEVLDLHNAEMELRWSAIPAGLKDLRLSLTAREEEGLSRRGAQPFSYPREQDRHYAYRVGGNRPMTVDGNQTAQDGLSEPLFKVMSRPDTGHPAGHVYGYVQSDDTYLYAALDFTVDNTLDNDKDWAALRVRTAGGWKDFRVTAADARYGLAGFVRTGTVHHAHKYYEFKIPLSELGVAPGDTVAVGFQAYGTAAEIPEDDEDGLSGEGDLYWVPGERSLLYKYYSNNNGERVVAILLDEGNRLQFAFEDWLDYDFYQLEFSPSGRQLLFNSSRQAWDPTSVCYLQGYEDRWSFRSLLNLTADLRPVRSAKAGGIQLRGTASDLNFASYTLEYAPVSAPDDWRPVAPASGEPVVDDLLTTWVPPGAGNYFVRLSVEDLAGNVRRTVKRVSWSDTPSITDVYRTPATISPNGDGINDNALIHYRVLEPVHLTFEFFDAEGRRVRTVARDHSTIGVEAELIWDGRDDSGLPVPDGKYRMTVQNYEFFVLVDSTPPAVFREIRQAYQQLFDANGVSKGVIVDPGLRWQVEDANLDGSSVERGTGADPIDWLEQSTFGGCALFPPPQSDDPRCGTVPLDQFSNRRFRVTATDIAGNKTVALTPLPAEQLIIAAAGNHVPVPCPTSACDPVYEGVPRLPYAPLESVDGDPSRTFILSRDTVRLAVAETLRQPIAQVRVQFRRPAEPDWTESPVQQIVTARLPPLDIPYTEAVQALPAISDHLFGVTWDMAGVQLSEEYVVRLHAIDTAGAHHYSNAFRFRTDGVVFFGLWQDEPEVLPLLADDPPKEGERILWAKEFMAEPLASVRLFVRSPDDPRFATAREIGSVAYPQTVFIYRTKDLEPCKQYFGYLEARTEARTDPVTGQLVTRTLRTGETPIRLPCIELRVKTEPLMGAGCDAPSPQRVLVKFAPTARDGNELKLLTLSRELPDGGGEDVLFNVNKPASAFIPPIGEPKYLYQYEIDTSQLPEGSLALTAKLINVNDEEVSEPVTVIVDHTPATVRLTYPLEGQRVCGVPRTMPDGTVRNVVTLEGEISDAGGAHYAMERSVTGAEGPFVPFHDSRGNDSRKNPPVIEPRNVDFHLRSVVGPLGELFNLNGEITARLRVQDFGGFERCETRTFYFDGVVEGARARLDRGIFSPNGDGRFDEVILTYEVDEPAVVDIDVHPAVLGTGGHFSLTGDSLRRLLGEAQTLPGAAELVWDGRDAGGSPVADGWYGIVVTFKDACGNLQKATVYTNVDNTPPAVAVAFPRSTDPLPMIVEIQGSVTDPHLQSYGVDFGVGTAPDPWVRLASRTTNTTGTQVLAPWNTFGLEGAHAVRVVAIDSVGNERIVEVPLNLAVRTNLISYLEAVPDLFSPNGDGKRETAALRFGLEENVLVTLALLDAGGTVRRTLMAGQAMNRGPAAVSWDGTDGGGNPLPDGTYTVGLLAELASNPLLKQEEKVTVVLDRTAPAIEITRPANGFVPASGGVVGTVQDAHMGEYTVSITDTPASPVWETLDSGTSNKVNAVFGSLQDRPEGEYALKVDAVDQGETVASATVPFIIDHTPPKATLTAPEQNTVVGRLKSPVNVSGTVEEKYLQVYRLNVGSGSAPTAWTELASGATLPLPDIVKAWDVSTVADGVYTLQLYAEDKAGLTGESRVTLTVDQTPPTAAIALPADMAYVKEAMEVRGSAEDPNFAEYRLEVAPGAKGASSRWSELGTGAQAVSGGVLLSWEALPPDGVHTLKLTVKDKADNTAEALVQVTVDTKPPAAPVNLRGALENRTGVRLTWDANTEPDLAGYAVYRDGVRITPELLTEPTYLDAGLAEGRYTYTVKAFDLAGWESGPSNEATLVIDITPPAANVSLPGDGVVIGGLIDVKGTAHSVDDFKEYRLYAGAGAAPTDFQLLRRSPVPVLGDVMTQWNTLVLAEGAQFTLKLEAEDINGNVGIARTTVTVDNLPPAAPTGLTAVPSGSNVQLAWNANTEADLFGYLVFRNERLANQQGVVVGSLKPYAIVNRNHLDAALPDGPYTYYIIAMDAAGNMSDPSAAVEVTLDTRAPHATIVQPESGAVFDQPLYLLATSPDTDIARVQFQYRAFGAPAWTNLGPPDTALPYEATFDPAGLGLVHGSYQLQAVATDQGNKSDPAPTPIAVSYEDVTAPATVQGLISAVDGGAVTLTWTPSTDADLAGYHIDRTSNSGSSVRLTSDPLTDTTYVDEWLDDDTYYYRITAVDTNGNEAVPSAVSQAVVYTPVVQQPYTPILERAVSLVGTGRGPASAIVEIESEDGTFVELPPVDSAADGAFSVAAVPLTPGWNGISVRLTDPAGNVSKDAFVEVIAADRPSVPTGLAAAATDLEVNLTWNPNPEPDVVGYRVFRNGMALLPDLPMTDLSVGASSEWWWAPAQYAVDFQPWSYWAPIVEEGSPLAGQWLTVWWNEPRIVTQVNLTWESEEAVAVDYDIRAGGGSDWVTVAQVRGNRAVENSITLARPYATTELQLVLHKALEQDEDNLEPVRLTELELLYRPLVETNSFTDQASDGIHEYRVSAVSMHAFESDPSEPVTQAVGDVVAPEPVTLTAAVEQADVVLTWTASASDDVNQYVIYRDGALIATHDDLDNRIYYDTGRPNGTYVYTVRAMDGANNESAPSNEAPATVAVTPPPAPVNLSVTLAPVGAALDLAWTPGAGTDPAGYRVLRSTTAGGPYQAVTETTQTQARDANVVNGTTYFYVVAALDAFGNASAYSNEASATAVDPTAPFIDLHYPTRPGRLYATSEAAATIVGRTEPGAQVTLRRNGAFVRQNAASALDDIKSFPLFEAEDEDMRLSPDGRYLVYQTYERELKLHDFTNGTDTVIANLTEFDDARPRWSADGREVLYLDLDDNYFNFRVRAYRLADGSARDITDPSESNVYAAAMAPDGKQLAVIGYHDGRDGLWRIDLASGAWTLLKEATFWYFSFDTLRWSPDSTRLLYEYYETVGALEMVHVPTASVHVIDENIFGWGPSSWTPDGDAVVFSSFRDGSAQIWRYQLSDGGVTLLTAGPDEHYSPVLSPDGRSMAYIAYLVDLDQEVLRIRDLASGSVLTEIRPQFNYFDSPVAGWVGSGYLGVWMDNAWHRIAPAGRVEFTGVALEAGDNVFNATAVDGAGNGSEPSAAIVINRHFGDRPDLVVADADIRLLPAAPLLGEPARISVTVRNAGTVASTAARLSLVAIDPAGAAVALLDGRALNPIAPGAAQTLSADWTADAGAGSYTLVAIVDPLNEVAEASEANNLALRVVPIITDAGQQLTATTDRPAYTPGEAVAATATVRNAGEPFSGRLELVIEDQQGYLVQSLPSRPVTDLGYGHTLSETASWPTGSTFAGNYQVHARLYDSGNRLAAEATAPFSLAGTSQFAAQVAADRVAYLANDNVRVNGSYTFTDGNTAIGGAQALLRILDSQAAVQAETQLELGDLLPGASGTIALDWNTGARPVGQYRATLVLTKDDTVLAAAETLFRIEAGSAQLAGSLALSDQAPAPGTPQVVTYRVSNRGNATLTQLPIRVSLLSAEAATPLATHELVHDIGVDGEVSGTVTFDTAALVLKPYTVVLRADVPADGATTEVTLATVGFTLADRAPPTVNLRQPSENGFVRGDGTATVFALDTLSAVKQVEISVDGLPFVPVPVHNAAENLYGELLRNLPEGTHTIAARATDAWNNSAGTGPLTFIVDNTPPQILVEGVTDGGRYNAEVAAQISFNDAYLEATAITLNGAPYLPGTAITTDGEYLLTAVASDRAGNRAQKDLRFVLDRVPPQIAVTGVQDGGLYNVSVVPVIQVTDRLPTTQSATLNGQPFTSGTTVAAEGSHELAVTATDSAGNSAALTLRFRIDKTPPAVTITQPSDGAVVSQQAVDVRGSTEPLASVTLAVGTFRVTGVADANGLFAFSQVPLAEGVNRIEAYARDPAGNTGPTAGITVRVAAQSAKLDGELLAPQGVLVWLPGLKETKDCKVWGYDGKRHHDSSSPVANDRYEPLAALIETTLVREGVDYLIVRNEQNFIEALRSRRYTTVVFAELHDGRDSDRYGHGGRYSGKTGHADKYDRYDGDDHDYDDDDHDVHLHMRKATALELQATVAAGGGAIWIKTHPDDNEHLQELFGAKPNGSVPKLSQVVLTSSVASVAGTWDTSGFGLRLKLLDGTRVGELRPGASPAMVLRQHGAGRTALLAFDPVGFEDAQGAIDTLAHVLHYAAPSGNATAPGAVARMRWTAAGLTPPLTVDLKSHLPEAMRVVAVSDGDIVGEREAAWSRVVAEEQSVFNALVRLPQAQGDYTITAELYENQGGALSPLAEGTLTASLADGRDEVGVKTLELLVNLKVGKKQESKLQRAIEHVQSAVIRAQDSRADAAYAITHLLSAYDLVSRLDNAPAEVTASIGQLLGCYQSLWSGFPP